MTPTLKRVFVVNSNGIAAIHLDSIVSMATRNRMAFPHSLTPARHKYVAPKPAKS